jgi:hypothetical protein
MPRPPCTTGQCGRRSCSVGGKGEHRTAAVKAVQAPLKPMRRAMRESLSFLL